MRNIMSIAHRGSVTEAPENTIPAFSWALENGADMLELDIRLAATGEVMVIHDATVDRTSNGSGPVHTKSLRELEDLDFGFAFREYSGTGVRIPTLCEVFERFPDTLYSIDIKTRDGSAVSKVVETIRSHGFDRRVILSSFHTSISRLIHRAAPEISSAASTVYAVTTYLASLSGLPFTRHFASHDVYMLPVRQSFLTFGKCAYIERVHRAGRAIHFWTIDDADEMTRLIQLGADGIVTNRVDVLKKVLRSRENV